MSKQHWAYKTADNLIQRKGNNTSLITCAAGISPSGVVHAGNLREIITSDFVYRSLKTKGANAKLIFSWDDFDRFRKVPAGIPKEFSKYIGMPYREIPDPTRSFESYAKLHESQFEESAKQLGIEAEFIYQYDNYKEGKYDEQIKFALNKRKEIAEILAKNMTQGMTEEEKENYYPISLYSRFSGNDNTKIISFDGENKITYKCKTTGKTDIIDITQDRQVKLSWKVDWPMRWKYESVNFEPGGSDHASPGGSYDVASQIAKEVFNIIPPKFLKYAFVRIKGATGKMSSSKGNIFSPKDLLDIYSPEMIRWLYAKPQSGALLDVAFDSDVIKAYVEFDRRMQEFLEGKLSNEKAQEVALSFINGQKPISNPAPFRQIVGMGDATDFNKETINKLLSMSNQSYNNESISDRLKKGEIWMTKYFSEARSNLLEIPNTKYYKNLNPDQKNLFNEFTKLVDKKEEMTYAQIEKEIYSIAKKPDMTDEEKKSAQRDFFKIIYNLLFGKDRGPRLPTFLWAVPKTKLENIIHQTK